MPARDDAGRGGPGRPAPSARPARTRRRTPFAVAMLVLLVAIPLAGCADEYGGGIAAPSAQVKIQTDAFSPARIEVGINQTVEWHNVGSRVHTVESLPGAPQNFSSLALEPGDRYVFTPSQPGTYAYRSTRGSQPTGEVVVR